ncbi:hypothetical protein FRC10_005637 [Ceratobasidium sp. 414]|nr:hypothetical protein FRC10_005637 [Ceratobasidium sp. 414]
MADLHQLPSHSPWISEPLPPLSPAWAGQPGNQDLDILLLRQRWLAEELSKQDSELKHMRKISVRIGTFNVNGQQPMEPLRSWLCSSNPSDPPSDLIVVGFQELDLSAEALLISSTTLKEDLWCEALMRDLAELGDQYVKLTSKQLVGVLIVVLIRKPVLQLLAPSGVASSSAGVGILGTMGNKGGVALRLQIMDTVLVFVNAHLAASAQPVPVTSDSEKPVASKPRFVGRGVAPADPVVERRNADYHSLTDFNYRIDLLDDEIRAVLDETKDSDYSALLSFDQLKTQQKLGKAFVHMTEGPITFPPTYRCEIWKKEGHYWDSKRRPAWTDRILYHTARGKDKSVQIIEGSYTSHPKVSISDHKPVSADFVVDVEELDKDMTASRLKQLVKKLGRLPLEEDVPHVKLSHGVVDWGVINSGLGNGRTYVSKYILQVYSPKSINLKFLQGVLLPGDSVVIRVTTNITNEIAARLNAGTKELEDLIILHTVRGKDMFVPVMGTWTRTCLAHSPDALVRLPSSVRDSSVSKGAQLSTEKASIWSVQAQSGAEALIQDELFTQPGDHDTVDAIVEVSPRPSLTRFPAHSSSQALDTGAEFPFDEKAPDRSVILSFGSALLLFLEEMPEPVVPLKLHTHCGLASSKEQAYEANSGLFTKPQRKCKCRTQSILAEVELFIDQDERGKNEGSVSAIGRIFAEVLWGDTMTIPLANRLSLLTRIGFLMFFIGPY